MKNFLVLTLSMFFVISCNTGGKPAVSKRNQFNELKAGAEKVVITQTPVANSCKELDEVVASINLGEKQRQNYMRNKAHKLGGDTVYVHEKNLLRTAGTIYKCK